MNFVKKMFIKQKNLCQILLTEVAVAQFWLLFKQLFSKIASIIIENNY